MNQASAISIASRPRRLDRGSTQAMAPARSRPTPAVRSRALAAVEIPAYVAGAAAERTMMIAAIAHTIASAGTTRLASRDGTVETAAATRRFSHAHDCPDSVASRSRAGGNGVARHAAGCFGGSYHLPRPCARTDDRSPARARFSRLPWQPRSWPAYSPAAAPAAVRAAPTRRADRGHRSCFASLRPGPKDNLTRRCSSISLLQVSQLSGGHVRIQLIFDALGQSRPDVEPRVAGFVRDGRFDLGWIGARAWDELGVTSFQALQAPFLITDYTLLNRVVTSSLARTMLAGLKDARVVGLALIPDLLRYPDTARRPLASAADFQGARLRAFPSKATDMLLRALGATPEHVSGSAISAEIASGRIDGTETSLPLAPLHSIITGNVPLFPRVNTLFVNPAVLAKLTSDERSVLRRPRLGRSRTSCAVHAPQRDGAGVLPGRRSDSACECDRAGGARASERSPRVFATRADRRDKEPDREHPCAEGVAAGLGVPSSRPAVARRR